MYEDFNYYGEEEFFKVISRFNEVLMNKKAGFFDVNEFEDIIDYYIDQCELIKAKEAYNFAIQRFPFASGLKLRNAIIYIEQNSPSKSLKILDGIEKIESCNYEFFLSKGRALILLNEKEKALQYFDKAIKLSHEERENVVYTIAQTFFDVRSLNMGLKYLLLAHELDEKNLLILYEIATTFDSIERYTRSIEYYEKYLEIDTFAENVWFNLGIAFWNNEQYSKAIDALDYAIAINPGYFSAYFIKGDIYLEMNEPENAIDSYNDVFQVDPNNIKAYCLIANTYRENKDYKKAKTLFQTALKIEKKSIDAYIGLAMLYKDQKKLRCSLIEVNKALALNNTSSEILCLKGEIYQLLNNPVKAANVYSEAICLNPNDYESWIAFAQLHYNNNKLGEAIYVLKMAYQYNYDISTINYQLAKYHLLNDQPSEAFSYFEKGLTLNFMEHNEYKKDFYKAQRIQEIKELIHKYKK